MGYTKIDRLKKELEHAISETNFELALDVVGDMLEEEPDNEKHWNSKGVILAKLDKIEESIGAFDRSLEIEPGMAKTWFSKGVVLMDNGKLRAALGCFYKTLDLAPSFDKARSRFVRCLDEMASSMESKNIPEQEGEKENWIQPPGEVYHSEEAPIVGEEEEVEKEVERRPPPRKKKRRGSYLDEEMFDEEEEEEEGEEDVEEDEMESWEELEEDDLGDDENWGDDDDEQESEDIPFITCRCGGRISVPTEERPFRFTCPDCDRTGTLK